MATTVTHLADHKKDVYGLQRIFDLQNKAFRANPMPSCDERKNHLKRIKSALFKHMTALENTLNEDFGNRCTSETKLAEMIPSLEGIKYHTKHLKL